MTRSAKTVSRRRFVTILAAMAAAPGAFASTARAAPDGKTVQWRGMALGAEARITLSGSPKGQAASVFAACEREIRRLEALFSLHDPGSALSRLNRHGSLAAPPPDFLELLRRCADAHAETGGAFDPTVQPLWDLYAGHFAAHPDALAGPPDTELAQALARTGFDKLAVGAGRVHFRKPGMSLTLNGIAQGFITDRVATLLRHRGFAHVLIDLGELRALGPREDGSPWRIGLRDPEAPWRTGETAELADAAMATSGGYGTRFDRAGKFHHLFDPRTGRPANRYRTVTVIAPSATEADALSTGFVSMPAEEIDRALRKRPGRRAILTPAKGRRIVLES